MNLQLVKIFDNIQELTGKGAEYLVSPNTGDVVAYFLDGKLVTNVIDPSINRDDATPVLLVA